MNTGRIFNRPAGAGANGLGYAERDFRAGQDGGRADINARGSDDRGSSAANRKG